MALVRKLEQTTLLTNKIHGEVHCTYTVFSGGGGKRYIQFDTYGSPNRKIKGKKSQSIQFDDDSARMLFDLLKSKYSFN